MPSIIDFSSALPWLVSGLVIGVIVSWLLRMMLGHDRRRAAQLESAKLALEDERRIAADAVNRASHLDAERSRLASEVNLLSPRAALVPQIERQLTDLRYADAGRQQKLTDAERELAQLRHDAETQARTAKYYEDEYARLFAEHEKVSKAAKATSDDFTKAKLALEAASRDGASIEQLKQELADVTARHASARRDADEAVRLRSELASAKASLEAAAGDGAEITRLKNEIDKSLTSVKAKDELLNRVTAEFEVKLNAATEEAAQLREKLASATDNASQVTHYQAELATASAALDAMRANERAMSEKLTSLQRDYDHVQKSLEDTQTVAASRQDEVSQLKAQLATMPAELENYRRFKDALDAANRIVAGGTSTS
jgi:chromosome segregation ATPase